MNTDIQTELVFSLAQLEEAALFLIQASGGLKVWIFKGEMGAGKTTLIKEIAKQMGVKEIVQSPTFSIVNEYTMGGNEKLFHFDFYRIKQEVEAIDIGVDEYLYSGFFCLIEWPEKIQSLLPDVFFVITISITENQLRKIEYRRYE